MIIVNQDKEEIINFENMRGLMVTDNSIVAVESFNDDEGRCLGEYKTEERAKEVLQKIIEEYMSCNEDSFAGGYGYIRNEVYYMPED